VSRIVERLRAKLVPMEVLVTGVETAAVGCIDVRFVAPRPFAAGDVLAVRVGGRGGAVGGTWRRYTVADTEGSTGRLVIERNEIGAAAVLFAGLRSGDRLLVRGPEPAVLAPEGAGPIVVVSDLTGLATITAVVRRSRDGGRRDRVEAAVVLDDHADERSAGAIPVRSVGELLRDGPDELAVLRRSAELDDWITQRYRAHADGLRFLAVGGHDLTTSARRAARAAGARPGLLRTRTYWKPGRTGLE
jgi:NADPH-dependent ferric siderophore reductase